MKLNVTERFVEERGGRLYAAGVQEVEDEEGKRLIDNGHALALSAADKKADSEATSDKEGKTTAPAKTKASGGQSSATEGSDIPAGFPERETLIAGGLDTVKKLKEKTAKDKIESLDGISKAKLTRIGLAIEEL